MQYLRKRRLPATNSPQTVQIFNELTVPAGTIEDPEALSSDRRTRPHEEYDEGILTVFEPVAVLRRASSRAFAVEIVRVRTSWDGRGDEWAISYQIRLDACVELLPSEAGAGEHGELLALLRDAGVYVRRLAKQESR